MGTVALVLQGLVEDLIRNLSGPVGVRLRRAWYSRRFKACGRNIRIEAGVHFLNPQHLSFGDDCWVDLGVTIIAGPPDPSANIKRLGPTEGRVPEGTLTIGHRCHLAPGTLIQAHGGVIAGDDFWAAAGSKLYSYSNDIHHHCAERGQPNPRPDGRFLAYPIVIGNNVFLGLDVKVFGHTIGSDVFIMPGSFVTSDIPENTVAGGSPAAPVRARYP
jgi:acetyltransferase-like isoleucine patch superfamily enzyme